MKRLAISSLVAVLLLGVVSSSFAALLVPSFRTDEVLRSNESTGAFEGVFASGNGLDGPDTVAIGRDGNLYVNSLRPGQPSGLDSILRYDGSTGAFIDTFVGNVDKNEGFTFGPDGNFYVTEFDLNKIVRSSGPTGTFVDDFVSIGLIGPASVVFGPDDNLYVGDFESDRILRFNGATGAFIDVFASGNALDGPTDLHFGPDQKPLREQWP